MWYPLAPADQVTFHSLVEGSLHLLHPLDTCSLRTILVSPGGNVRSHLLPHALSYHVHDDRTHYIHDIRD